MSEALPARRAWNCHSELPSPSTAPGSLTNITQNASPCGETVGRVAVVGVGVRQDHVVDPSSHWLGPFLCQSLAWPKRPRFHPLTAPPAGVGLPTAGERPALMFTHQSYPIR